MHAENAVVDLSEESTKKWQANSTTAARCGVGGVIYEADGVTYAMSTLFEEIGLSERALLTVFIDSRVFLPLEWRIGSHDVLITKSRF